MTEVEIKSSTLAPSLRRAGAWFIDMSLVSLMWLVILALALMIFLVGAGFSFMRAGFASLGQFETWQTEPNILGPILIFLVVVIISLAVVSHGYFILYEKNTGTTPGKRSLGLSVRSIDGAPLTWGQVTLRDFARWYVDGLFFFVALFTMALTKRRQRIGDLLAGTEVLWTPETHLQLQTASLYLRGEDFKRISAVLAADVISRPIEQSTRNEFLKFAYASFIAGRAAEVASQRPRWLSYIRERFQPAPVVKLGDDALLRYFAALCEA